MADREHPPGWEFLKDYRSFIAKVQREKPGFFTAFNEAMEAQKRANEVRQTAILTDVPTEAEFLERLREKYDLIPRHSLEPRDQATGTRTLLYETTASKATQTEGEIPTLCGGCSAGVVPEPLSAHSSSSFPSTNPFAFPCPNTPIYPIPSTAPTPPSPLSSRKRPAQIPSLLNCEVNPFLPANPRTLEYLRSEATSGRVCWNCGGAGHGYPRCPHPATVFCFGCGMKGTTKIGCPNFSPAYSRAE